MVAETAWPMADKALTVENEVTIPVQVNGKRRGEITIARDADNKTVEAAALALDAVQAILAGQAPKKIVIVPQRIINVVA
jgi:leucyl-tRNA synthetase